MAFNHIAQKHFRLPDSIQHSIITAVCTLVAF